MRPVSFAEAVDRVRAALSVRSPEVLEVPGFRPAAVLVPILHRPAGPTLLFTRRTERVPSHKGEISFPGGAREQGEDAVRAALREAEEEVTFRTAEFEVHEPFELPLDALRDPAQRRWTLFDPARLPPELAELVQRARASSRHVPFEDVDPATGQWRIWSFHADPARVVWGLTARVLADLLDRAFPG